MSLLRRVIGVVLRRERQRQGLTLREVARAAGVSVPYLSEVERGRKEASSEVLAAVCRALGLYLSDLLEAVRDELRRVERRMPSTPLGTAPLGSPPPPSRHADGSVISSARSASGGTPSPVARLGAVGSHAPSTGWLNATGGLAGTVGNELAGLPFGGFTPVGGVSGGLRITVFTDPGRVVARGALRRPATVTRPSGSALRRARRMRSAALTVRLLRTPSHPDSRPRNISRRGGRPAGHLVPGVLTPLLRSSRDLAHH
ncbi:helix-turn-helix transcriptional regulator [Micromonospora fiedleri]|uniref:Helix-turn-helix transcriptional regulator n=1 Tax=Micromonospora fiedleri TaxID=1157498 RepID=A0ABS1URT1_9ACTN|nr:helix-turn-helix transcriptional regulator [Micromonospora fiedleri]